MVKKGQVSFNFDDADVYSVIQTIFGEVLKVNYIVDPNVKGRVTFRSVAPVALEDVLPLMEVILRINGIGIVEEAGLYRIVPIGDISKEPAAVGVGREAEKIRISGKALVQVIPVRYIQSSEMVRVLTPFLSKNAVIIDIPKGNYIVVSDTDANVKRLLQLVEIFDNEKLKEVTPRVFVYSVQNGKAKDVAAILQQIFLGAKAPAAKPATPTPGRPAIPGQPAPAAAPQPTPQPQVSMGQPTGGEALVSEVTRIIPDEITNSLIILATPEDYALIVETIKKVDIVSRQVVIEGLLVRVDLTDNLDFGMQWVIQNDFTIKGFKPFNNDINIHGPLELKTPLASPNFTFTALDAAGNVKLLLQSLATQGKAKILASPHILVSDNREARIQVGQQIPIATSTTTQPISTTTATTLTNVSTSTIQYKDIGIILKVKPQINDSGLISLELTQEVSSQGADVNIAGQAFASINKTEVTTNLVALDSETIIIGGLIREDHTKSRSGIPFLSRIPVLGYLFGSTNDDTTRAELIILLTPRVVRNMQEASSVTSDYVEKYKGIAKDKEIDKFIEERGKKEQNTEEGK